MFQVRYKDTATGAYTTMTLWPRPTTVEYPEARLVTKIASQDGNVIVQRPLRDGRERRWVWKNYPPRLSPFIHQWQALKLLEFRTRATAGVYPVVEIWEDDSTRGGFDRVDGQGNKVFTKVRFLAVDEKINADGGLVRYDEAYIEFVIEDTTYTAF